MMKQIEHIGIAVKDLENANQTFSHLLGKDAYKEEIVETESVKTSFFKLADSKIELLQATNKTSAIGKYLDRNRQGMHHIALAVEDIHVEISRLKSLGFIFIDETPKIGADNKLIVFIHPKSTHGVLVELCQEIDTHSLDTA